MVHNKSIAEEFSERLIIALERKGITRYGAGAYLRKLASVTGKSANNWLNGEKMPRRDKILIIASQLNVRPEWLEYGEGAIASGEGPLISVEQTVTQREDKYGSSSPKAQKIISDIIALDSSGALNDSLLDMLQSMLDSIPKKPNRSAKAFRD